MRLTIKEFFKNLLQKGNEKSFDIALTVQQMFDEAGIVPQRQEKDIFRTTIDGVHCSFDVMLERGNRNRLFILTTFPIPVPDHIAASVALELNRLTKNNSSGNSIVTIEKTDGVYSIWSYTDCRFTKPPTPDEVKALMIHTVDLLDGENFCSLCCAIMGYATNEALQRTKIYNAVEGDIAAIHIAIADNYRNLDDMAKGVSASRYGGRLLRLAIHIIENGVSKAHARKLLKNQTPLLVIQEAYNLTDYAGRDVLRKLLYLAYNKKDNNAFNENEGIIGQREAVTMIEKDIYLLLKGDVSLSGSNMELQDSDLSGDDKRNITPEWIDTLEDNEIFVFGCRNSGRHLDGASHFALENFGAIMGQREGRQGQSYAIPTIGGTIGLKEIRQSVETFTQYAEEHPELHFLVTPIGCGGGCRRPEEIAPMFRRAAELHNVSLPESFLDIIGS